MVFDLSEFDAPRFDYVFMCCVVHYDLIVNLMFGSSMPLFVLYGFMFYLCHLYLFLFPYTGVQHVPYQTMFVSQQVQPVEQKLPTVPEHLSPPPVIYRLVLINR